MPHFLRTSLATLLIFCATSPVMAREWTSSDGRKLQAEFVSITGSKITLKRANGKVISVDLSKLSEADRKWVSEQKDKPTEPAKPSEPAGITGPYARLMTGKWELEKHESLPYAIYGKDIDSNKILTTDRHE